MCGCKEQILHNLSEAEANRIVSRLHAAELAAEKVVQSDGRWAISLPEREASEALRYLEDRRVVSSQRDDTFGFTKGGLIPSREEQRFRYERSIAAAIEESLQAVKGVLEARVHLNLPQSESFFGERGERVSGSSAVLLLVDEHFDTEDRDIARLVAGAAGLQVERISVLRSVTSPVALSLTSSVTKGDDVSPAVAVEPGNGEGVGEGEVARLRVSYRPEYGVLLLAGLAILLVLVKIRRRRGIGGILSRQKQPVIDHEE